MATVLLEEAQMPRMSAVAVHQLLGALAEGKSNEEIARELGYTTSQVHGILASLRRRIGVHTRIALAAHYVTHVLPAQELPKWLSKDFVAIVARRRNSHPDRRKLIMRRLSEAPDITNRELARELVVGAATIATHLQRCYVDFSMQGNPKHARLQLVVAYRLCERASQLQQGAQDARHLRN